MNSEAKEQIMTMPESTTIQPSRTIVTSTSAALAKKIIPGGVVSVKLEPPDPKNGGATRFVHLVQAGSTQPNILKRAKPPATHITLAPKRQMVSTTTYVTTIPSPPSSTSSVNSENGQEQQQSQQPSSSKSEDDFDKSPLSLLAEEAARRTPTLNLAPCMSLDVPLDPKFIGGPIIAGKEQIDIRKSEIVCQQISEHKLTGPYVVLIAHSHREYRGTMIRAENFEGFKEDTEAMKRWPLRAWTDSAYSETQYVLLDIPKLGTHPVAIVTLKDENVINLRFPVLSSDRNNHGHKKFGRLWEEIIFPYDKLKTAYHHWHITPIQIVAELRDPNKLKKPKRPDLITATMALPMPYRTNPSDYGVGSPGFLPYESDEEDSKPATQQIGQQIIKREPVFDESITETSMQPFCNPADMTKEQLIASLKENYNQVCANLSQTNDTKLIRWILDESSDLLNRTTKNLVSTTAVVENPSR